VVSERIPRNNLERAGLKIRIEELSNLPPYHPFEFHLANREEGEWYLKRIKELIIETGGAANVVEQVNIARQAYSIFDVPERLSHHVFHGSHRWDGTKSIPWLKRWLGSPTAV